MQTKRLKLSQESRQLLNELGDIFELNDLRSVAGVMADVVAEGARKLAPGGPTGNLKCGITSKVDLTKFKPAAYVSEDPKIAPHGHLVEYGTPRRPAIRKKGKAVYKFPLKTINNEVYRLAYFKQKNGTFGWRWIKQTGIMPKQPFMRPALDQNMAVAIAQADAQTKKIVANKTKKLDRKFPGR